MEENSVPDLELNEIKYRAKSGLIFLTIRNFGLQAISIIGFFSLTYLLGAYEVGLFGLVSETVAILGYFSDIGLAAALIQQKDNISTSALRTTFTIQQILVFFALIIAIVLYPGISQSKHFGQTETFIFISLCFGFICASLKTIPSVLLERKLDFKFLSTIDIIENVIFYLVAVILAIFGFKGNAYAYAIILRSLAGVVLLFLHSPWPIGLEINQTDLKKLLKFGIPFQGNSFIAVLKDRISSLYVTNIIGATSFGYLTWAQKIPRSIISIMDAVMRVSFPAMSRMQHEPELIKKTLAKTTYYISLITFPILALSCLVVPELIKLIPKYSKWEPAIFPMYFYCLNAAIAAITTPITNAFNAIGNIKTTTKLMVMWLTLTWLFYPFLSNRYGYLGTAYAALIVGCSSFVVWFLAYKKFSFSVISNISYPTLTVTLIFLITNLFNTNNLVKGFIFFMSYIFITILLQRQQLYWLKNQYQSLKHVNQ